jgi:tetratricopeptide (TPR) repeat protein
MNKDVKAWVEKVLIPTYKAGKPQKNPMFLEKRVYQGSSGVVYPNPIIETIENDKSIVEYNAVFLENEYLKIMILPELGGRIQRAYDKVRNRDFVYYNEVIKPALVGLAGPWISGGIEFNWPQHHRPSTFSPVDFTIAENEDGSKTVWVNEIELMFRTKGMAGFTLYPEKAYLEIKGKLFNRTNFPQTFLWWANPAVNVNEHYQSVFPPDVFAVFDHGKRAVSDFPIATGTYYKVDYSPGTDISRYNTIPVPTSYMAIESKYDFMGCYEHDNHAGMLHVANHHLSPGKKQWTWGDGDFGYAWDRNLTDENGPYIELMTGVFTDNQPDFSWLQPNENKSFEQYFMPYAKIGIVKNATKDAMLNIEFEFQNIYIKVYTTSLYKNISVQLFNKNILVKEYITDISPDQIFEEVFAVEIVGCVEDWRTIIFDENGKELVTYQPELLSKNELPPAATAAKAPSEIEHIEDLYLNGLHLEQYRHATYNPVDYYEEGLKRSPRDYRCNNAMGLLLLRRGQFKKSEPYFRTALKTITQRNPNPYDGEAHYNLGLALKFQENKSEAYKAFYKATWNDAWQHSGFFELARIDASEKKWLSALNLVKQCLNRNFQNSSARHLNAAILRKLKKTSETILLIKESLGIDPFNFGCLFEAYLIHDENEDKSSSSEMLDKFHHLMRNSENNYLELALDYSHAGLYEEAIQVLQYFISHNSSTTALPFYYLGFFFIKINNAASGIAYFKNATQVLNTLCFPNKIEEIVILNTASSHNPSDARANLYLGNLWYDKRQYTEAIECWENAIMLDNKLATAFRNLSLAYYNKLQLKDKALLYMEKAFSLDDTDARVLMELDQLYKISGKSYSERLAFLESYGSLIENRDDLYLEIVVIYNNLGQFEKARNLLMKRKFHPWEGGEGKVIAQYLLCNIELARMAILNQNHQLALKHLTDINQYPENLGEGKLFGTEDNERYYLLGCSFEAAGLLNEAKDYFVKATVGISEPLQAIYYNDVQPDKIFFQALSWIKLGDNGKANEIFMRFQNFAKSKINEKVLIDYFAVSLPDMLVFDIDINIRNHIHCKYLMGLASLGLGDFNAAKQYFNEILDLDINHQGAIRFIRMFTFISIQNQEN